MALPIYTPVAAHHEMYLELNKYFIKTCTNAIVMNPPTVSEKGIARALKLGYRALVLDVHDVPGSKKPELIVKAQGTLKSVPLVKCIKTVAKFAFEASPYPVVLVVRNNCSEQEAMVAMATIIETNLQGKLYVSGKYADKFQSPENLKGMVLLSMDGKLASLDSGSQSGIPPELKRLIYVGKLNLTTVRQGAGANYQGYHDVTEEDPELQSPKDIMSFTERHLLCTSPRTSRINSSYNASYFWHVGVQMSGINMYANDLGTWINETKFSCNGGTGYLVRPGWQLGQGKHPSKMDSKEKKYLRATVLRAAAAKKGQFAVRMLLTGQGQNDTLKNTKVYDVAKETKMKEQTWMFPLGGWNQVILIFVLKDHFKAESAETAVTVGWAGVALDELREGQHSLSLSKPDGSPAKAFVDVEIRWG